MEVLMKNTLAKIEKLTIKHDSLDPKIIKEKDIKLGLRNQDGTGVVVGMTTKGRVVGYNKTIIDNDRNKIKITPVEGQLFYCGYNVQKIVEVLEREERYGFDETVYLLLTGELPSRSSLSSSFLLVR